MCNVVVQKLDWPPSSIFMETSISRTEFCNSNICFAQKLSPGLENLRNVPDRTGVYQQCPTVHTADMLQYLECTCNLHSAYTASTLPAHCKCTPDRSDSLRSEICRTLRIQVGCTHARTIKNHHNAFLWGTQNAILICTSWHFSEMHCCGPSFEQFVLGWVQRNLNFGSSDHRLWGFSEYALLWSQFVLGWVQRNLNFGSSDHRLWGFSEYSDFGILHPMKIFDGRVLKGDDTVVIIDRVGLAKQGGNQSGRVLGQMPARSLHSKKKMLKWSSTWSGVFLSQGRTYGWTLPSILYPCFTKAGRSINMWSRTGPKKLIGIDKVPLVCAKCYLSRLPTWSGKDQGWHISLPIYRLSRYIGTFWNIGYRYR